MNHLSLKGLILPIVAMGLVIVISNILVTFPFNYHLGSLDLGNWLTFGAFSYPLAFLVTDLTNRIKGVKAARLVIIPGFILGFILSILLGDLRIAIASGTAFLVAQLTDITIFNYLRQQTWWKAPLISSLLASALDTVLFFSIAFMGTDVPWIGLGLGDFTVKILMALVLLPMFRWLSKILIPVYANS